MSTAQLQNSSRFTLSFRVWVLLSVVDPTCDCNIPTSPEYRVYNSLLKDIPEIVFLIRFPLTEAWCYQMLFVSCRYLSNYTTLPSLMPIQHQSQPSLWMRNPSVLWWTLTDTFFVILIWFILVLPLSIFFKDNNYKLEV